MVSNFPFSVSLFFYFKLKEPYSQLTNYTTSPARRNNKAAFNSAVYPRDGS